MEANSIDDLERRSGGLLGVSAGKRARKRFAVIRAGKFQTFFGFYFTNRIIDNVSFRILLPGDELMTDNCPAIIMPAYVPQRGSTSVLGPRQWGNAAGQLVPRHSAVITNVLAPSWNMVAIHGADGNSSKASIIDH